MRAAAALLGALPAALGHGLMVEPASRATFGVRQNIPAKTDVEKSAVGRWSHGCPGWGCNFMTYGTDINCIEATGNGPKGYGAGPPACDGANANNVTATLTSPELRTYDVDSSHGWYQTHPWRYPGKAPIMHNDGCGTDNGAKNGASGSALPPLTHKTLWTAGAEVEVAYIVYANHGGGYQYRICPKNKTGTLQTEDCFQRTPLPFVGDTSWLVKWDDASVREPFTAHRTSTGTWPEGSTWSRNSVAACVAASHGLQPFNPAKGETGGSADTGCAGPLFPPIPSQIWNRTYGWGQSACVLGCSDADHDNNALNFHILDKVKVPDDLPPGDYVVSWRWDCEQTEQIWNSCADVTVQSPGSPVSDPFPQLDGCDACNIEGGPCAQCKPCLNDKTSKDCKKCWKEHSIGYPSARQLPACLGQENPFFNCTECWSA